MARKRNVPVPPDRELDRLYRRFEDLSAKVAANEFKSEMGGSRLADMKLRYQVPKLERVRIAHANRLNRLLDGRTVEAGTKSSLDSLRKVMNSPMRGGAGAQGLGRGQGGRGAGGGGSILRGK
jgi:hypothetical protein